MDFSDSFLWNLGTRFWPCLGIVKGAGLFNVNIRGLWESKKPRLKNESEAVVVSSGREEQSLRDVSHLPNHIPSLHARCYRCSP